MKVVFMINLGKGNVMILFIGMIVIWMKFIVKFLGI